MDRSNPVNVFPDPDTWTIGVLPTLDGDVVVETFRCLDSGERYTIVRTPEGADEIATLLHTAVTSPRIGAEADQRRAALRDREQ